MSERIAKLVVASEEADRAHEAEVKELEDNLSHLKSQLSTIKVVISRGLYLSR